VRLNQIQVLGSHNSFHVPPRPPLFQLLLAFSPVFSAWEYEHLPLDEQFATQGVRQIELDVFYDPVGGHYGNRPVLALVGDSTVASPAMFTPGMKVLHIQDVDFETTCERLVDCLVTIRQWSDAHPHHLPLMILIEAKDDTIPDPLNLGFTTPLPFTADAFDALDAEIRSVFGRRQLLTPDDVRRGHATLEEAILTDGWPTLGKARGKVMFLLDNGGSYRTTYLAGHPSLEGRVLFTDGTPGEADAAFVKRNDVLADPAEITTLVQAGYLVRTRADVDTTEARADDPTRRDAALSSGAQCVSTDFPAPSPTFGTSYFVEIPGGAPARCNPVNAPAGCRTEALERLP
jgi:hypothetical protein